MRTRAKSSKSPTGTRWSRRSALQVGAAAISSPLLGQTRTADDSEQIQRAPRPPRIYQPVYSDEVMAAVNVHEMEDIARQKVLPMAYDYIAGGSSGELTVQANRESFMHIQIRRRVGVDVSKIDTSLELLGKKLDFPILLGPGGHHNMIYADGERVAVQAAAHSKAICMPGISDWIAKMKGTSDAPTWWAPSLGFSEKEKAQAFAKRAEDAGASALCITVDYLYTPPRDREVRNNFDYAWVSTTIPANPNASSVRKEPMVAGMIQPFVTGMTWKVFDWLHSATKLPVAVKGIVTAEDANSAVENGAQCVIVSNHGGRTLDGMIPTLYALPEVVKAVNGRVPVLMDGGIRRGSDIVKAMSLGAKAVLIGRPYYWGLAAFGQVGVQRVIEMLHGEMMVAMAQSGIPNLASFDRSLVEWLPGSETAIGS